VGEAAARLAHEIKNPLLVIGGFVAQVRRKLPPGGKEEEKLRIVEEEAARLEAMLREVQGFTRQPAPRKERLGLNAIVDEIVGLMEPHLKEKGIACGAVLGPDLPETDFDPAQVKQVLLNLVKNAAEASAEGGRIVLRTWKEPGRVRVSVADTGSGMSEEVAGRAFSPFYTTKDKGSGLGLAVSFRIVQDHDGEIGLETAEGKGTTVTVSLPLPAEEDKPAAVG
jgi:signal transduction histidine kinase